MPDFAAIDKWHAEPLLNCMDECLPDYPSTKIYAVVILPNGGGYKMYDVVCGMDAWKHPEDEREEFVGTHWLSDDLLEKIAPDDLDTYKPTAWREDCRTGCDSKTPVLVVGIDPDGQFHLLCLQCAEDVQKYPNDACNRGMVLHGTHILDDEVLRDVFPEDFEDEG